MLLYHGSDTAIAAPDVARNTGFADLGRGFYLTDDRAVAAGRAATRARATGAATGFVSVYEFDEDELTWLTVGDSAAHNAAAPPQGPFGLAFASNEEGLAAWMRYITRCRAGDSALEGTGEPAVARGWIATMEVEMAASGLCEPEDVLPAIDPAALTVQFCFRDQAVADVMLRFIAAEEVPARG